MQVLLSLRSTGKPTSSPLSETFTNYPAGQLRGAPRHPLRHTKSPICRGLSYPAGQQQRLSVCLYVFRTKPSLPSLSFCAPSASQWSTAHIILLTIAQLSSTQTRAPVRGVECICLCNGVFSPHGSFAVRSCSSCLSCGRNMFCFLCMHVYSNITLKYHTVKRKSCT